MLGLAGGADLDLAGHEGAIGAHTVAALLGVAGNKNGNLGILLQDPVLVQHHLTGHTVVAAATQVILLHQFLQILLTVAGGELPKQLSDLLLIGHGGDGAFHPGDILVAEVVGLCS